MPVPLSPGGCKASLLMATIRQLWTLEMAENPRQNRKFREKACESSREECFQGSRLGSPYPQHKNKITQEALWLDAPYTPPSGAPVLHHLGPFVSMLGAIEIHDNADGLLALLEACARKKDLQSGNKVHDVILQNGLLETYSDALVIMYARCGALSKAKELLDMHKCRSAIPWHALIAGYAQQGQDQNVLIHFEYMQHEGLSPDVATIAFVLKSCRSLKSLDKGEQIHKEISRQGLFANNTLIGNALLDMYVKCGALVKAQQVFEELSPRNIVSWNTIIAGHAHNGQGKKALRYFDRMRQEGGLSPNAVTFSSILKACGSSGALHMGKQIHEKISREGLLNNLKLGTALVDMYVKCGSLVKAREVLEDLPSRDVISWNVLLSGYAQKGHGEQALTCFEEMRQGGISPDAVTFVCMLQACASIRAIDKGERIHDEIDRQGFLGKYVQLGNALVDMYAKCGALQKAHQVLLDLPSRNIVTWNALIAGYAQGGHGEQALKCFQQVHLDGLMPDAVTYTCILKSCGSIGAIEKGEEIHDTISRRGLLENNIVLGTALVDMYAKCGALEKAQRVLKVLQSRDVVSWSALISGYAQQGQGEQALNCFECMQREGLSPNAVTFASILKACASIGAVDKGEQIHDAIAQQGLLKNNIILGTALVDMYAKCGALSKAHLLLKEFSFRDVVLWGALMAGYVQQGHAKEALCCFKEMQDEGLTPDTVAFSSVLLACSQLGLVEDGYMHFMSMSSKYGMKPVMEHYICMVDLLGRAGHLDKAGSMIKEIPFPKNILIWTALLGACQIWGDVNIGRWAFEEAVLVDRTDSAAYILMSNIYVAAGMPDDAKKIDAMRIRIKASSG
ncbi:hypothetical protein GOP47_0018211 [Adiantum capillus-veneris]|uniref:Pentatricopeptide repeat-containing protein n=1 Tax=Adiantum capillus-veneris TaxID=13818 RepID=A0A9D4UHU1_ADICA|nr:hypothetical protein GOP47_0018211 [Adiantum capillus-veneris]